MAHESDENTGKSGPPTINDFSLSGQPGHLLRLCQQRAVDLFAEEVGENGPTPRQFAILLSAYQKPGLNQTDLVRLSGIDRSTLTEVLRRLVDRGLIRRERIRTDLRTNALYITPDGEDALRRALPGVVRAQERILAPIAGDRRDELVQTLGRLSDPANGK